MIRLMKIKNITYLLYKKISDTYVFKLILDYLGICDKITVQINHTLCSNGLNNKQLHVNWFNVLVDVLGNNAVCIPVFKFTLEKLLGSLIDTDIQWLQPVCAVGWDNDIH